MTTNRRWLLTGAAGGALLVLSAVSSDIASAQSLGDLARRDAERRAQAAAGRVYTNADLVPEQEPAPSPVPVPVQTPVEPDAAVPDTAMPNTALAHTTAPGTATSGEAAESDEELDVDAIIVEAPDRYDEQRRERVQFFQERVTKAEAGIAAAQARLSRLDRTPQTPTTVREREVITATLQRLQRDADSLRDALALLTTPAGGGQVPAD